MTAADLKELVATVRYKKGWRFYALDEHGYYGDRGVRFEAEHEAPDVRNPTEVITVKAARLFSAEQLESVSAGEVAHLLADVVHGMEMHEVDEWLVVDGARVTEPHAPPRGLYGKQKDS